MAVMRARQRTFREILRARNPLETESFRLFCDKVAADGDPSALREFFVALNRELGSTLEAGNGLDVGRAGDLCLVLVEANSEATGGTLADLLREATLQFHDPLVAVMFEAAGQAPALLTLLADIVDSENYLLQFRVRALEALVTKLPGDTDADPIGLEIQPTLRFLNSVLDELQRGLATSLGDSYARWAESFAALTLPSPGGDEPEILEWAAEALGRLASAPTARETVRLVLRLLRANAPLPSWHPAAGASVARPGRPGTALVVDKAILVVLGAAGARWRAEARGPSRPARPGLELWPFNERVLEAALVDSAQPPRARAMAAGLLRVLDHASPSMHLSPRAELYSELFLAPHRRGVRGETPTPDRLPAIETEEQLDLLLEALGDNCYWIRRAASETCHRVATQHPVWFRPQHYTALLPFLSDDDPGIRVATMRTFQALAGFRSGRVAAVVDNISARLHDEGDGEDEEERARRDLEIALGITMDRLVDDVEQLQREVQALESRRRDLLEYIEKEAVRVGEEIHHEVLNTMTSYLATAIDEEDYRDAKFRLANLVAELRRVMNNLYPRDLETEGFLQTIRNRLRDTKAQLERRRSGCEVELDCPPEITDSTVAEFLADRSHLVLLYRIILEGIINARKHSGGSSVRVCVREPDQGVLEITVCDNGSGHGGPFGQNAGIALMRHRAEEIGAEIAYRAAPDGGTMVVVRVMRPDVAGVNDRSPRGISTADAVS
jgi:signal transduction histidine kinase